MLRPAVSRDSDNLATISSRGVIGRSTVTLSSVPSGIAGLVKEGVGYMLEDLNPADYGTFGDGAVQLGISLNAGAVGATGDRSFDQGDNNTASGVNAVTMGIFHVVDGNHSFAQGRLHTIDGWYSAAFGYDNTVSETKAFSWGQENTNSGEVASTGGQDNFARSFAETSFGVFGTDYTADSKSVVDPDDRVFNVGVGTGSGARIDGITLFKSGILLFPGLSDAEIDTGGATSALTKGYADANYTNKGMIINVYNIAVDVDTTTGLASLTIPASLNGYDIIDVTASVHTLGTSSGAETIDINIVRRRAGADVNVLSTAVTLAKTEYFIADGTVDTSNDDMLTGDMLIPILTNNLDTTDATGLTVTIEFIKP